MGVDRAVRLCRRAATIVLGAASACVADPLTEICPVDALVITEIRGKQDGTDTRGQWVEITNVSDETIDLRGLHLSNRQLDDTNEHEAIVRYRHELPAEGRFVLGVFRLADRPPWVDYALDLDWYTDSKPEEGASHTLFDLHVDGFIELSACGETIDEVAYGRLPGSGTYALGLQPPDADGNDDPDAWCTDDDTYRAMPPVTEIGKPGTPRRANPLCP